jgi:hypothetical protein
MEGNHRLHPGWYDEAEIFSVVGRHLDDMTDADESSVGWLPPSPDIRIVPRISQYPGEEVLCGDSGSDQSLVLDETEHEESSADSSSAFSIITGNASNPDADPPNGGGGNEADAQSDGNDDDMEDGEEEGATRGRRRRGGSRASARARGLAPTLATTTMSLRGYRYRLIERATLTTRRP